MEKTKFTETREFKVMVIEELLEKVQMDLAGLSIELISLPKETAGEVSEQMDSIQGTVSKAVLLIREC